MSNDTDKQIETESSPNIVLKYLGNIYKALCSFPEMKRASQGCADGCNKPGIGSSQNDPYADKCSDCAAVCLPCAFIADLLTCPYRSFYEHTKVTPRVSSDNTAITNS